jgi:hypothetical protein
MIARHGTVTASLTDSTTASSFGYCNCSSHLCGNAGIGRKSVKRNNGNNAQVCGEPKRRVRDAVERSQEPDFGPDDVRDGLDAARAGDCPQQWRLWRRTAPKSGAYRKKSPLTSNHAGQADDPAPDVAVLPHEVEAVAGEVGMTPASRKTARGSRCRPKRTPRAKRRRPESGERPARLEARKST